MNLAKSDSGSHSTPGSNANGSSGLSNTPDCLSLAVPARPADPLFGVNQLFKQDKDPHAVNGSVGVYQNELGYTAPFQVIREAEKKLAARLTGEDLKKSTAANYLAIEGHEPFCSSIQSLMFGADSEVVRSKRAITIQSIGGTGSLALGARLLQSLRENHLLSWFKPIISVSTPTWENHMNIFGSAGYGVDKYAYYDSKTHTVAFDAMLADLRAAQTGSVVLLHGCCHNPTGVDLTNSQWDQVVEACIANKLLPFIDLAYQGFGTSLDEDAYSVRAFAATGTPFVVANSLSKIMGMYNQRVGSLTVVTGSASEAINMMTQVQSVVRSMYSNPPRYGAEVAGMVLTDPELRVTWEAELASMTDRINGTRQSLLDKLTTLGKGEQFAHIGKGKGMFSMTGLTKEQVHTLRSTAHIYMPDSGRICVATLNPGNIDYVAEAIGKVL
jgi:aromatic-amino-acid transaminase